MSKLVEIIYEDAQKIAQAVDFSEVAGKTVLITGASGLIGTYFVATLYAFLKQNNLRASVCVAMHSEPADYLQYFLSNENFSCQIGDITNNDYLQSLPQADYIIHAAGYGQPGRFMEDQVKTIAINTASTLALFKKLLPGGKFLFISTSEVYSGLPNPPYRESEIGCTNTTHPRACYIEGKRCGEAIVGAYRAQGVSAKSARLALAYGPGTKVGDARVINNFIFKALQGKINLLDSGVAKRTYCYVSDAVRIMSNILLRGQNPIYNVGGNSKTTIGELAKNIGEITGATVVFPIVSTQALAGAPEDVGLDMSLVEKEFGKIDFIPFEEGLKRTVEWQTELYNNF